MIGNLFGLMAGARQISKQAAISNGVTAKCEAVRADAGARVCDPSHAVLIPRGKAMERAKGIEPSYAAWEAAVLPLNYARLDAYQADLAETAPSAKRLGVGFRRDLDLVRIF